MKTPQVHTLLSGLINLAKAHVQYWECQEAKRCALKATQIFLTLFLPLKLHLPSTLLYGMPQTCPTAGHQTKTWFSLVFLGMFSPYLATMRSGDAYGMGKLHKNFVMLGL